MRAASRTRPRGGDTWEELNERIVIGAAVLWVALQSLPGAQQPAHAADAAASTDGKLNVIAFGAHPDDCDQSAGGTAAKLAALGHHVRFVSVTNGDAGSSDRRRRRAGRAAARGGAGGGPPDRRRVRRPRQPRRRAAADRRRREQIIRQIRQWNADLVLAPRPNDYHPDHRYTGVLIQDAAYMVVVPNIASDTPALRKNPVFMYFEDGFQKPAPFRPDVAVSIDDVIDKKIDMMDAHVSQMYEWLPWVDQRSRQGPERSGGAKSVAEGDAHADQPNAAVRAALVKWYGQEKGSAVSNAEAFEICEYGTRPDEALIRKLLPFFP